MAENAKGPHGPTTTETPLSSHIAAISYDPEAKVLYVHWRDGTSSAYDEVPAEVHKAVAGAWSVGSAMHRYVRGKYAHRSEGRWDDEVVGR